MALENNKFGGSVAFVIRLQGHWIKRRYVERADEINNTICDSVDKNEIFRLHDVVIGRVCDKCTMYFRRITCACMSSYLFRFMILLII